MLSRLELLTACNGFETLKICKALVSLLKLFQEEWVGIVSVQAGFKVETNDLW